MDNRLPKTLPPNLSCVLCAAAFGRVGGEEFAAFLAVGDQTEAESLAETIRAQMCRLPVQTRSAPVPVSVSIGVAVMTADAADWDRLFSSADRALYQAKRSGRNRTVVFDENSTAALANDDKPSHGEHLPDVDKQVDALRRIGALSRR